MSVHIEFNKALAKQKIVKHWNEQVLAPLSEQILADCNQYCKEDTGALIASSQAHSRPKEGKLIWQTPYARRQYYKIRTAHTTINPGARWRWAHFAKSAHLGDWQQIAQKLYDGSGGAT